MVCVTVYSEPMEQLMMTLNGIFQNLRHFKNVEICNEDIIVVIIFDGIDKMHDSMNVFFNDFDKRMLVDETKTLSIRKE